SLPYRSVGPRAQRHMTAALLLRGLDLVLVSGAVIFLLLVIIRRGRIPTTLGLALLLIVLAAALWYSSIRNAPPLPWGPTAFAARACGPATATAEPQPSAQ